MRIALFDRTDYDDLDAYRRFGTVTVHTRFNTAKAKDADITFATYSRPPDGPGIFVNMCPSSAEHLSHVRGGRVVQAPDWYSGEVARWVLARVPDDLGLRVAVIGRGRVGTRVYRFLRMRGYDVRAFPHTVGSLPPVDVVSLHVRLTTETRGRFGAWFLVRQCGVVLLNSARRALVDDAELRDALRKGRVARACIDQGAPFGDPRVEVTPHIAWRGERAARRRRRIVLRYLREMADGKLQA